MAKTQSNERKEHKKERFIEEKFGEKTIDVTIEVTEKLYKKLCLVAEHTVEPVENVVALAVMIGVACPTCALGKEVGVSLRKVYESLSHHQN